MRSRKSRRDRHSAVVCTLVRAVATVSVVGILGLAAVRCTDRIATAYETVARIAVGQSTQLDARVQLDSRNAIRLQVPMPTPVAPSSPPHAP
jgi:hypothetical protein